MGRAGGRWVAGEKRAGVPLRTLEQGKWKGGWRPGLGEEEKKAERKTKQNRQCLDGLSRVIEKAHSGPNTKAMFLQVLRGNNSNFVFWMGERNGK